MGQQVRHSRYDNASCYHCQAMTPDAYREAIRIARAHIYAAATALVHAEADASSLDVALGSIDLARAQIGKAKLAAKEDS